ncbi:unnamed protein product, partial [Staurois parvus]
MSRQNLKKIIYNISLQHKHISTCFTNLKTLQVQKITHLSARNALTSRGGLTIWKLGHCPRARDAPGTFFIGFFEFGQKHRGPKIPYCSRSPM